MSMSEEEDGAALLAELDRALDGDRPASQEREAPGEQETAEQAEERLYRREGRRFVAKEAEKEAAKEAVKDEPPVKAEPAPKAWKPLWYKDEYGQWDSLAEPLRKALEQREKEFAQGIEKHSTAAKAWEPVAKLIEPHAAQLARQGLDPQRYVTSLIESEQYLRTNPVEAINWLAQQYLGNHLAAAGYSNDVMGLAQWMFDNQQQPAKVDPVQQELAALKKQFEEMQAAPQRQFVDSARTTISEWSKDKPHYADVERIIAGLIKADPSIAQRFRVDAKATLDSLYEQAMYAHPQLRERILTDQRNAEVAKARATGATSPRSGAGNAATAQRKPTMSLEEEIGMHLDGRA